MDETQARCRSILIVEDEKEIREALAALLDNEGYVTYTAINGQDGLQHLATMPKPCLILLDYMMPVMDGQEFVAAKAKDDAIASIPVVVVSAFEDRARSIPASGFIKKPIDFDGLLRLVSQYCDSAILEVGHG